MFTATWKTSEMDEKKNSKFSETICVTLINAFEMFYSIFDRKFAKPIHYASKYDLENQEKKKQSV